MQVSEFAQEYLVSKKDAFPSNPSSHGAEAWPDKMWVQTSALMAAGRSMNVCMCVFICGLCVTLLAACPPSVYSYTSLWVSTGLCVHSLAFPRLGCSFLDMANVNRCCAGQEMADLWEPDDLGAALWQSSVRWPQRSRKQWDLDVANPASRMNICRWLLQSAAPWGQ